MAAGLPRLRRARRRAVDRSPQRPGRQRRCAGGGDVNSKSRWRKDYRAGGSTVYRITTNKRIGEGAWTVPSWIPREYSSCCSAGAAAMFSGRLRQLASTAVDHQNMIQQYVKTPRMVRAVKSKENRGDQQNRHKALRFFTVVNWSSRIYRMATVEQKRKRTNPVTNNRVNLNSSCPVDHPRKESPALLRFLAVTPKCWHGDHLDHFSGEVTL